MDYRGSQSMQSQVHGQGLSLNSPGRQLFHQNISNEMEGKHNMYDIPQISIGNPIGKDGPSDTFPNLRVTKRGHQEGFTKQRPPQPLLLQQNQLYIDQKTPMTWSTSVDAHWQEEAYQKIKAMEDKYLPELSDIQKNIAAELKQYDSLPQQPKTEQLDKIKLLKIKLEVVMFFLSVSKNRILPGCKERLNSYEKHIINFIYAYKSMKLVSFLQQGQISLPDLPSWLPMIRISESDFNQMNPQMPSMMPSVLSPGTTEMQQWWQTQRQKQRQQKRYLMQQQLRLQQQFSHQQAKQQSPEKIKTDELPHSPVHRSKPGAPFPTFSPLLFQAPFVPSTSTTLTPSPAPGNSEKFIYNASCLSNISHQQAGSKCPAPDPAGNGMSTMSISTLSTDFGKPNIVEKPHDPMVNMAKPNSLRSAVVTMVDEAATAVGEDLTTMRKQGLYSRNLFTLTGMSGAEKMRFYMSALVILALIICFIFNLSHQY